MIYRLRLMLYGSAEARTRAYAILENLPQVKKLEKLSAKKEIQLILSEQLNENSLIPLLRPSGVSGFRLLD